MGENNTDNNTPWTDEEKQLLIDNYPYMSNKELMVLLNKTDGQLRGMKSRLGLNSKCKPFTQEEKDIIISYYKEHDNDSIDLEELSLLINRQKTSICRFARKENLTNNSRPLTEKAVNKLKESLEVYRQSDKFEKNRLQISNKLKEYHSTHEHPKGMLGKHHSEDVKKIMSKVHIELFANMSYEEKHEIAMKAVETKRKNGTLNNTTSNAYSRTKGGIREDLGQYFRSSWEANVARILNHLNIEWIYEVKRFIFESDNGLGVDSYQPDFYLPKLNMWIEVKGWLDKKSENRLKLFKEYYHEEYDNLIFIDQSFYNLLRYTYFDLEYWEDCAKYTKPYRNNYFEKLDEKQKYFIEKVFLVKNDE